MNDPLLDAAKREYASSAACHFMLVTHHRHYVVISPNLGRYLFQRYSLLSPANSTTMGTLWLDEYVLSTATVNVPTMVTDIGCGDCIPCGFHLCCWLMRQVKQKTVPWL